MSEYHFTADDVVETVSLGDGLRVDLDEARKRFGRAAGVDRDLWMWTAGDLRWMIGHWWIFRRELALCDEFADDLARLAHAATPVSLRVADVVRAGLRDLVAGAFWSIARAPMWFRGVTAVCILYVYAFALGRF